MRVRGSDRRREQGAGKRSLLHLWCGTSQVSSETCTKSDSFYPVETLNGQNHVGGK